MSNIIFTPLFQVLGSHFHLGKSRVFTLMILISGLAQSRTVNLSHIASHFPGSAQHSSNYRRLQRFFQYVRLDGDVTARLIISLLNYERPRYLALDRTNWKLGSRDINLLVLALVTRRFRVPLMWMVLDHAGNSNTTQRIALMERYLRLFGASSIKRLLADREFVGAEWLEYLCQNNILFVIRIRASMQLTRKDGRVFSFRSLLQKPRHGAWQGRLNGMTTPLHFAAKRAAGKLIIIATNTNNPKAALQAYRKRWAIECLFGDAKTRGLNLEDTHITDKAKLATLMAVVAMTIAWAYRCASTEMGRKTIPRKSHGRREKSWFRFGFDTLRRWIINNPEKAIEAWIKYMTKIS